MSSMTLGSFTFFPPAVQKDWRMFGFALLDRLKTQTNPTLLCSYLMPPLGLAREMSGGPYPRCSSVWLHQYALDEGRESPVFGDGIRG